MKKFIRIMAIVAAALTALSLLLLLITLPFQRAIAENLLGNTDDVLALLPRFPLMDFLFTFLSLGFVILLVVLCGSEKGGVWPEILVFCCLAVVIPAISSIVEPMYTTFVMQMRGTMYMAADSVTNNVAAVCQIPATLGNAIAYAVCGMSVVYKRMIKRIG